MTDIRVTVANALNIFLIQYNIDKICQIEYNKDKKRGGYEQSFGKSAKRYDVGELGGRVSHKRLCNKKTKQPSKAIYLWVCDW